MSFLIQESMGMVTESWDCDFYTIQYNSNFKKVAFLASRAEEFAIPLRIMEFKRSELLVETTW